MLAGSCVFSSFSRLADEGFDLKRGGAGFIARQAQRALAALV